MHLHPASFKDPSGFLFSSNGVLYRQVHRSYAHHYDKLIGSGLYENLVSRGWLIKHEEVPADLPVFPETYKTLRPERLSMITYPYEWCFVQLQQAAIRTLDIMRTALDHGMILKDASAYNIQFRNGQAVLIDTLSFEEYDSTLPFKLKSNLATFVRLQRLPHTLWHDNLPLAGHQ